MLDATDIEIIKSLAKDGRRSSRELALQLGLHPSTVQRRIDRLVSEGTLRILPVVDPAIVGINWVVFFTLSVSPCKVAPLLERLTTMPHLPFVSTTMGRYNVACMALFYSDADFEEFLSRTLTSVNGFREVECFVCQRITKGKHIYSLGDDHSFDGRLISLLYKDARQSIKSLAAQLGSQPSSVRRRLLQLNRAGKLRVTAVVDINRVGPRPIAIAGLRVINSKSGEIQQRLADLPVTRFVAATTGHYDILVVSLFNSFRELNGFIKDDLARIDGVLTSETMLCLDIAKGGLVRL
jgi:Lrp/AsnC family transcriptional regulator for asnA, asnC and gidA